MLTKKAIKKRTEEGGYYCPIPKELEVRHTKFMLLNLLAYKQSYHLSGQNCPKHPKTSQSVLSVPKHTKWYQSIIPKHHKNNYCLILKGLYLIPKELEVRHTNLCYFPPNLPGDIPLFFINSQSISILTIVNSRLVNRYDNPTYHKVASSNTSLSEAHAGFFWFVMKEILLSMWTVSFWQKNYFLISKTP